MTYNAHQILDLMFNYNDNIALLENIRSETTVSAGIAQYGIVLPKAEGETGDPVFREYVRRNRAFSRYGEITEKLLPIQNFVESPDYDLQLDLTNKIILDLTLDGQTQRAIARIVNMSYQNVQKKQLQIAETIATTT